MRNSPIETKNKRCTRKAVSSHEGISKFQVEIMQSAQITDATLKIFIYEMNHTSLTSI